MPITRSCNKWQMATFVSRIPSLTHGWLIDSALVARSPSLVRMSQPVVGSSLANRLLSVSTEASNAQPGTASRQAEGTVIVGGGLAGLATAVALRSIPGLSKVHVLEALPDKEFHEEKAGAAVQLGANGLRALRAIGGGDLMTRVCNAGSVLKQNITTVQDAQVSTVTQPTVETDSDLPLILVRWGVLRSMLASLLPPECLYTGFGNGISGCSVRHHGDSEVLLLTDKEGQPIELHGTPLQSPLLVGADGLDSTFRYFVHGNGVNFTDTKIEDVRKAERVDTGRVNIKAVTPVELGEGCEPNTTYSLIADSGSVACFAGPAGSGYTYWSISVADDNGKAFVSSDSEDLLQVKEKAMSLLRRLESPDCHLVLDLVEQSDPETIFVRRSQEAPLNGKHLVAAENQIVLVGDAACAMNAAYGQGASFAFEDAATLAVCIRDHEDLTEALQNYGSLRMERRMEMQRRGAERALKVVRGENTDDVSRWIFDWDI